MKQIGYGQQIAHTVKNMPYDAAIRTEEIAGQIAKQFAIPYTQATALTNVKLKRMADQGEIKRLQKGVYCQLRHTAFGKLAPTIDKVMTKALTLQNGKRIGYESGAYLLNQLGLTTQIPRSVEIATNLFGMKLPENCNIQAKKPPMAVTDENWKYLQFLDLVNGMGQAYTDAEHPQQLLLQYVKKRQLDRLTLIFWARRYYPREVVLPLIDLLMEV